jgi:hypothetical protein
VPWRLSGCYSATSISSEQRIAHLSPVENGVGRVLQGCHAAAQILDVVEVVLDRLANDVGPAAVELLGGSIQLSAEDVGEAGRDLDRGKPREITVMLLGHLPVRRPVAGELVGGSRLRDSFGLVQVGPHRGQEDLSGELATERLRNSVQVVQPVQTVRNSEQWRIIKEPPERQRGAAPGMTGASKGLQRLKPTEEV